MGADPRKNAAEWFYNTVFKEEAIRPRPVQDRVTLPSLLRAARSLENGRHQDWQSRESLFLKQGKLLANYEDDFDYRGSVQRYYPTYQALLDEELRGYFSWRTKLRRGDVRRTSLSFAFLYIYELINQIGVADPMDGWRRLLDFRDAYGSIDSGILSYLERWLPDYVIYYGLDPELLAGLPQVQRDRSIAVLDQVRERDTETVMQAVRQLAPKWLDRSKFYAEHAPEMDEVTARVLRRVSAHYAARCKKTLTEQYFGSFGQYQVRLFEAAVFCDPLKRRDGEYHLDEERVYRCAHGMWSVWKRTAPPSAAGKLEDLVKTIDSVMRETLDPRHPVKPALNTKWLLQAVQEETEGLLAEKRAAVEKEITIDYAQLTRIRQDAAVTQEKLIVDEEADLPEGPAPQVPETPQSAALGTSASESDTPLAPAEYRLLQCLLYGGDTAWVQAEGHLLSVLVDGINEKLYDTFLDSVLDDTPELVDDYIEDLKEMVHP